MPLRSHWARVAGRLGGVEWPASLEPYPSSEEHGGTGPLRRDGRLRPAVPIQAAQIQETARGSSSSCEQTISSVTSTRSMIGRRR